MDARKKGIVGAIYHHRDCIGHSIRAHPESPARVVSIMKQLRRDWPPEVFRDAPLVEEAQILLFHTEKHLADLKKLYTEAERTHKQVNIDGDTAVMGGSRLATLRAAGSIVAAVDDIFAVCNDRPAIRTAFCCTRPPGHHAERHRAMGFCFLNNAGIAARYAQDKYGVGKVAILDFDVHHGNGSEHGFRNDPSIFYGSTHEKDNYPGTGVEPPLSVAPLEEMTALREKIGDELFTALCGDLSGPPPFDMPHFTGLRIEVAESEEDRRIVNRAIVADAATAGGTRRSFRRKWREVVYEMVRFEPGLVILSAGFDAHKRDPLASLDLLEADFEWATKIVMDACRCCGQNRCGGKELGEARRFSAAVPCISILEGGYNIDAITSSAAAHVKVLFGEATAHVHEETLLLAAAVAEGPELQALSDIDSLLDGTAGPGAIETLDEDIDDATAPNGKLATVRDVEWMSTCDESLEVSIEALEDSAPPLSIEEILASLDMSIDTLMVEALLHTAEQGEGEDGGDDAVGT